MWCLQMAPLTDFRYILRTHCSAVIGFPSRLTSNCSRVLTNQMGLVSVLAMKPAQDADSMCTTGLSGGSSEFQKSFACEYVQK